MSGRKRISVSSGIDSMTPFAFPAFPAMKTATLFA